MNLEFNDDEQTRLDVIQKKIGTLEEHISGLTEQILNIKRDVARRMGLIANTLDELQSENGEPFVEYTAWGGHLIARAGERFTGEMAYLCKRMYGRNNLELKDVFSVDEVAEKEFLDDGFCGWVKGEPYQRSYNDIGMLSGSAGDNYYCILCVQQIGTHALIRS